MRKLLPTMLAACGVMAACVMPASADQYDFGGPSVGEFAEPTSQYTVYVGIEETVNIDRSKTAALIPPVFGSPTSYLLNTGEPLTPNLLLPSSQTGAASYIGSVGVTVTPSVSQAGIGMAFLPPTSVSAAGGTSFTGPETAGAADSSFTVASVRSGLSAFEGYSAAAYTEVSPELYYSGGELGTLSIPSLGLKVNIYQGTDNAALAKGAGHFTDTSIWDGNVALAAHNRGVANHFGNIHSLNPGDTVILSTMLGARSYEVVNVSKISVDDGSVLAESTENQVTLVTCVMNEPQYRWCVIAKECV